MRGFAAVRTASPAVALVCLVYTTWLVANAFELQLAGSKLRSICLVAGLGVLPVCFGILATSLRHSQVDLPIIGFAIAGLFMRPNFMCDGMHIKQCPIANLLWEAAFDSPHYISIFAAIPLFWLFLQELLHPLARLPGPPLPGLLGLFVGHIPTISKELPAKPQYEWALKYAPVFSYRFFYQRRAVFSSREALKRILVSNVRNYVKPMGPKRILKRVTGDSLLTTEGERHAQQRVQVAPAFRADSLRSFISDFRDCALRLTNIVGSHEFSEFDIGQLLMHTTLDVIGKTAFGFEFDSLAGGGNTVTRAYQSMFAVTGGISVSRALSVIFGLPNEETRKIKENMAIIRGEVDKVIQNATSKPGKNNGKATLLSLMLDHFTKDQNNQSEMSDQNQSQMAPEERQELVDAILTFMVAGHETTSVGLSWGLLLLAKHPDVLERLRLEVDNVLPNVKSVKSLDWDDIESMPYLKAVVHETLRLFPPAAMTVRLALEDDVVEGVPVPAGSCVTILPAVLHRLPWMWGTHAEDFVPERWLPYSDELMEALPSLPKQADGAGLLEQLPPMYSCLERCWRPSETSTAPAPKLGTIDLDAWAKEAALAGVHPRTREPFGFLAFLAGERSCIGQRFAVQEMCTLLAVITALLDFQAVPDSPMPKQKLKITLRAEPSIHLLMRRRK